MSSFGFGEPRTATMAGLNGKLSEVNALLGRLRLTDYDSVLAHRAALLIAIAMLCRNCSFN